jgi:hypothetical protein
MMRGASGDECGNVLGQEYNRVLKKAPGSDFTLPFNVHFRIKYNLLFLLSVFLREEGTEMSTILLHRFLMHQTWQQFNRCETEHEVGMETLKRRNILGRI